MYLHCLFCFIIRKAANTCRECVFGRKCVSFLLQCLFELVFSAVSTHVDLHAKWPLDLSGLNENWNGSTFLLKNSSVSNLTEILLLLSNLFERTDRRTDGRTDWANLIGALHDWERAWTNLTHVSTVMLSIWACIMRIVKTVWKMYTHKRSFRPWIEVALKTS
jgi:hypothetical protein